MKEILGGKGAGLSEMTRIGLPVPAGFTITTEACDYYMEHDKKYPPELAKQVTEKLRWLEKLTGKKLGDANDPLLVSVRSGSARSMPGMMETILNLGLNSRSVEGLARRTSERFAYDAYRRFVQMYSSVVLGLPKEELEDRLHSMKNRLKVKDDPSGARRSLETTGFRVQGSLLGKNREGFSRGSAGTTVGRHRRGVRLVDGRQGRDLSARRAYYRLAGHGCQRGANGVREHGRQFRYGRLLYARSFDRRKDFLRRLPDQRAGRRRGGGHSHAHAPLGDGEAHAESLQAA